MADIQQRSVNAKIDFAYAQAEKVNALFKVCEADTKEYWQHPRPPLLKSCVEFQTELKQGIKDMRASDECNADMLLEIPSCKLWKKASDDELERLRAERNNDL
jgi:hypothetical protein